MPGEVTRADIVEAARDAVRKWDRVDWPEHTDESAACSRAVMKLERLLDASIAAQSPYIVAETSKTWIEGAILDGNHMAKSFEEIIETNARRGYCLHSWNYQMAAISGEPPQIVETIVAVFAKEQV